MKSTSEESYKKIYTRFVSQISTFHKTHTKKMRLGIAASGGPDSLLLILLLDDYRKEFSDTIDTICIIHIIDGLELVLPETMPFINKAQETVRTLAQEKGVPLRIIHNTDITLFEKQKSFESACHRIRKNIFSAIIKELSLDRILTGHNKDDQLEHFFIALIRRSSLKRISGMAEDSRIYLRPLLTILKEDIILALEEKKQPIVVDPCNESLLPLRNKIRSLIIPVIKKIDTRATDSILSLCQELRAYEEHITDEVENMLKDPHIKKISFLKDKKYFLKQKIIEKYCYKKNNGTHSISRNMTNEIIRFLEMSKKNKHIIKNKYYITKKKNEWKIEYTA